MKSHIKKITLNVYQLENIDLSNKIFNDFAPQFIPLYFKQFIKNINARRERFCFSSDHCILYIYIMNNPQDEKSIKLRDPGINFNFIPNFP